MRLHSKMVLWWSHDLNWDACWNDAEVFGYKSITGESGDKHILPVLPPKSMLQKIKAFFSTCLSRQHVCSDCILVWSSWASHSMGFLHSWSIWLELEICFHTESLCSAYPGFVMSLRLCFPMVMCMWNYSAWCVKLSQVSEAVKGTEWSENKWRKGRFNGAQIRGTETYQHVARKEEQGHAFYRGSCLYSAREKHSGKALDS